MNYIKFLSLLSLSGHRESPKIINHNFSGPPSNKYIYRSSCYDSEHQLDLHCDSQWLIDPTPQPWEDIPQSSYGDGDYITAVSAETSDANSWTEKERYLLEKGLVSILSIGLGKIWPQLNVPLPLNVNHGWPFPSLAYWVWIRLRLKILFCNIWMK